MVDNSDCLICYVQSNWGGAADTLKYAKRNGLIAVSGLWMLVYQGAAAFEKWSGILPDEDACKRAFDLIKQ